MADGSHGPRGDVPPELLEELGSALAHDLSSPLRVVRAYAQMLRDDPEVVSTGAARHLDRILEAAERAAGMSRELARLARVGRSGTPERIDLAALVDALFATRKTALGAEDRLVADALPVVHGDHGLLATVLGELLDNAIKFRAPERPLVVRVSAEAVGEGTWVRVSDTGMGFDPDLRPAALRPFMQLHPRGSYEGLGLGLTPLSHGHRAAGSRRELATRPRERTLAPFNRP
ncbi:MAG: HAMP domain-containing sensor histidine kinase, partial [Myxococcota bacterium]